MRTGCLVHFGEGERASGSQNDTMAPTGFESRKNKNAFYCLEFCECSLDLWSLRLLGGLFFDLECEQRALSCPISPSYRKLLYKFLFRFISISGVKSDSTPKGVCAGEYVRIRVRMRARAI